MALQLFTPEQRLDRSIAVVASADWCCWDAVAVFRINTRLFAKNDVAFCRFNNGQGLRCIVCGWSAKFGRIYGQVYAAHSRSRYHGGVEWSDHQEHATIEFLLPPERCPDDSVNVSPEVRGLLLERYAQRFPQVGRCE